MRSLLTFSIILLGLVGCGGSTTPSSAPRSDAPETDGADVSELDVADVAPVDPDSADSDPPADAADATDATEPPDAEEEEDVPAPPSDTPAPDADATLPPPTGCAVFPADNPWNTDISGYPVHPMSESFVARIGAGKPLHPDFGTVWNGAPNGIPYTLVPSDQPKVAIDFSNGYEDESDPGPYPVPPDAPIEGGADGQGDRHVIAVDMSAEGACMLYELFGAHPQPDGSWQATSGAVFDLSSNELRPIGWTSADAAGLPIFPGLVRRDEVEAGEIPHALRFTVQETQRAFVLPATHWASAQTDADLPPMGLRFRLKASVDISGFSPANQVILTALKTYGMIVADNGGDWFLSGAPSPSWNDDDLNQLKQLTGADFEAVDTGPIHTSYDL